MCNVPAVIGAVLFNQLPASARVQASGEANVHVRNEEFLDMTRKKQLKFVYVK